MINTEFTKLSNSFFSDPAYTQQLQSMRLDTIDRIFSFRSGKDLNKKQLASWRNRIRLRLPTGTITYLKTYNHPPITKQIENWISNRAKATMSDAEKKPILELRKSQVSVPDIIAFGSEQGWLFESRSFIILKEIPHADALERKLPSFFYKKDAESIVNKHKFIKKLADFIRKFHRTGYRHRDLYFSHIFCDNQNNLYLIDLARAFKPKILSEKFRIKDLAQLFFSAQGSYFSKTDRMRFYRHYSHRPKLATSDKKVIRKILKKVNKMSRHNIKHDSQPPFMLKKRSIQNNIKMNQTQ